MNGHSSKLRSFVGALLFALLIGAQSISLAHAYEHDPVSLGDTACATCISINQMASAAIDTGHVSDPAIFNTVCSQDSHYFLEATPACVPKQRGPPHKS